MLLVPINILILRFSPFKMLLQRLAHIKILTTNFESYF